MQQLREWKDWLKNREISKIKLQDIIAINESDKLSQTDINKLTKLQSDFDNICSRMDLAHALSAVKDTQNTFSLEKRIILITNINFVLTIKS